MKQKLYLTLLCVLIILMAGCGKQSSTPGKNTSPTSQVTTSSPNAPVDPSKDQANAYYTLFLQLYDTDNALNANCKYIVLDLSRAKLASKEPLIVLMTDFCKAHDCTLLLDTYSGLEEKGYIKSLTFEEGILISFEDKSLSQNELVTSAQKWRSGTGAIGAQYTVRKKDNKWTIVNSTGFWIS